MSNKEKKSPAQGKALETFILGFGKIGLFTLKVSWHGLRRSVFGSVDRVLWLFLSYGTIFALVYWNWCHLVVLHWLFPKVFTVRVMGFFVYHVSQLAQSVMLSACVTVALGVIFGIGHFAKMVRYQKAFRHLGLKSATGDEPKVIDVEAAGDFHQKITVLSLGVGLDQYKAKKADMEATFGSIVEDIRVSERSRKLVEIHLVDKELPTHVSFEKCAGALTEPYSFLVGESLGGVMAQSIRSLPHLLIAGTSGNGKSVFFNQALISMLKTSPHIQLYLLDLKLGVEVKVYGDLPNVKIAKDANEAVQLLKAVVTEMSARFKLLEKNGNKIIDPEKDKKDLILVGVDEASVLYKKKAGDKSVNELVNMARDLTDEITKLGRAACIHLIAATQKVTTKTIDTDVQENIGGRICFRVGTLQGSNVVLGNKKAFELPDIKGRAIWGRGNDFTEVQTPFVSDKFIGQQIAAIKGDFESGKRKCLQPLLVPTMGGVEVDGALKGLGKEAAAE